MVKECVDNRPNLNKLISKTNAPFFAKKRGKDMKTH